VGQQAAGTRVVVIPAAGLPLFLAATFQGVDVARILYVPAEISTITLRVDLRKRCAAYSYSHHP
jgi:hypothetical protein